MKSSIAHGFFACVVALCSSLLPQTALGAKRSVTLAGEMCDFVVPFDPAKTSEAAIKDTFELLVLPSWAMTFSGSAFSAADIDKINMSEIERGCAESITKVKSLKLLPVKGAEDYRKLVIRELEDSCTYHKLNAAGYRDPSVLRQYGPASKCMPFVDALDGKSDLAAMFDKVVQASCADNADTKSCIARAQKKRGDVAEMKVEVQNYGWNNCAINYLLLNTSKSGETREKLRKSFFKAYKVREKNCEEP